MRRSFVLTVYVILFFTFLSLSKSISQVAAETPLDYHAPYLTLQSNNDIGAWWNESWHYRVPFTVYSGSYDHIDGIVEKAINFTSLLNQWEVDGTFDPNSVRVIEYNSVEEALYEVPSQFDEAIDYDAHFNAFGNVAWVLNGTTPANTTRSYFAYFDIVENDPKDPPSYAGVSHEVSGNYIFLKNEKIKTTIRYRTNGTFIEELYLDRDEDGIFESDEEMIGKDYPYRLLVKVTKAEQQEHMWADPFFESSYEPESTFTLLRDGPIIKEIKFSNVTLKNRYGEALNLTVELIVKVQKLSATVYVRTIITMNEDLDVDYAYEYDFFDHKSFYDKWYVSENYNGNFSYEKDFQWGFEYGVPTYGFLNCYNSSGNGGMALIPNMNYYSKVSLGEYRDFGPAIRLFLSAGTWPTEKKIELENRLFVHLGDWSEVKEETLRISHPPTFVNKLYMHLVDFNDEYLNGAKVEVYNSFGSLVRTSFTNSTGWLFLVIESGEYTVRPFWMGLQVANITVSISNDVTIAPLKCSVYSLTVYSFSIGGEAIEGVTVSIYLLNGTRISSSKTISDGSASFRQIPGGDYMIKTYYLGRLFGAAKNVRLLNDNAALTIYETPGLGPPQEIRYDVLYALVIAGIAAMSTVVILKKGYERIILGLLLVVVVLVALLAVAYIQSRPSISSPSVRGISAEYNDSTGLVSVGEIVRIEWKDSDKDGRLDDKNLLLVSSDGTELAKIDLQTSLITSSGAYSLYEAETRNVLYFDTVSNDYNLWQPLQHEPDFMNNEDYQRNLKLKFSFSKANKWEVNLLCSLEQGKPFVQLGWEIVEKGDGAGSYSLYPQIIQSLAIDRMILPANYTDKKLLLWNQRWGLQYGNPWTMESDWPQFGAYVANMHVSDANVVLHSSENYKGIQTKTHASSAFARYSNWVHDTTSTPPYFQYDFWVDWDGKTSPSSDIEIEVWVPDALDLDHTEILYSSDGTDWSKYTEWTLIEGNRGDPGFSSYGGCRHRLLIIFPASNFLADDGTDTGTDYGDPNVGNDEYLVRLKIAYLNEGLATYEFEDSPNKWYGLQNINGAWMWLMSSKPQSLSIGIVVTKRLHYLAIQVDNEERFHNLIVGIRELLTNNSRSLTYTNIAMFSANEAARGDHDSDEIINMFDDDLPRFFPTSALFMTRESLGKVNYERKGFNTTLNHYFWSFSKEPLTNDWNVTPYYSVCLPKEIQQHLESDDATFQFERYGYFVYNTLQSNEIRWKEEVFEARPTYQLYAMVGLIAVGLVLSLRCKVAIKKHWIILALFMASFGMRLYLQSLAVDFSGNDAAFYGDVAKNVLGYGRFETNMLRLEPHWVYVRAPPSVTRPYSDVTRWLSPSLTALSFAVLGESFFAIKAVDVILGSLVVLPTYYLAKKLFNEKTAIVAALIVAFYPLLVYYSGAHPGINIVPALFAVAALCSMVYESKKAAVATGLFTGLLLLARFEYAVILAGVILSYYLICFKRNFWRQKNLYIIAFVFLIVLSPVLLTYYSVYGRLLPFSTKVLGGTLGEVRAPSLWETLSDPNFIQIRLYNLLYRYWYALYQTSPLIFITAVLGLLMNIRHWRKLSALYLFPFYIITAYSFVAREQPHQRYVVQFMPILAILSAAFILELSRMLAAKQLSQLRPNRKVHSKQMLLVFIFVEIIFMSFLSQYLTIGVAMRNLAWSFNDGKVYRWIGVNTPENSVIMAPSAFLPAYYTDREVVGMPHPMGKATVDMDMIIYVIKQLSVDYVILDRLVYNIPDLRRIRENPLSAPSGFTLVYWAEDPTAFDPRVLIYDVRALHG